MVVELAAGLARARVGRRAVIAVVMLAAWSDYLVGLYGWCLLRGYDVTIGQLANPLHPYPGKWPPPQIGPGRIFPGTRSGTGAAAGSGSVPGSAAAQRQTARRSVTGTVPGSRL